MGFFLRGILTIIAGVLFVKAYRRATHNKKAKDWGRVALIVVSALVLFYISIAVFPLDSFYVQEFEENTLQSFPKSGTIKTSNATYPDQHGSYTSCAVITVSERDYNNILGCLRKDSVFRNDTSRQNLFLLDGAAFHSKVEYRFVGLRKAQFKIGFLNDHKTIYFERHSS